MASNTIAKAARTSALAAIKRALDTDAEGDIREAVRDMAALSLYEPSAVFDLLHEILQIPASHATAVMRARPETPPAVQIAAAPRKETEAGRVVEAAKVFLRQRKQRCTSGTITAALDQAGVAINGEDRASRVSAYLSAAKTVFDNVRGEGYGLREWHNGAAH